MVSICQNPCYLPSCVHRALPESVCNAGPYLIRIEFLHSLSLFSICSTFYEDWAFVMDEERSSMLPTMAAGKLGQGQGCGAGGPVKPGEQRCCLGVNV